MPTRKSLACPKTSLALGVTYLLLAWLFGTIMTIFAKNAELSISVWTIVCIQGLISLVITLPIAFYKKDDIKRFSSWKYIIWRSVFSVTAIATMFLAAKYAKLVDVFLLTNTTPIFIPIVAFFWLKTKIPFKMWISILVGFLGIIFVLRPDASLFAHPGVLYALIPGITLSFSQILMRLMADKKETPYAILFYYLIIISVIALPGMIVTWKALSPHILWLLLGGGICNFGQQICFLKAFSHARPVQIGPINYSAVVFSYIAGWLLWNQEVKWLGLLGIILVIAGGVTTLCFDKKTTLKPKA